MADKTPTKAELAEEIAAAAAAKGVPVPEGLSNVQSHFDALEALTGKPDPRRPPKVGAGAVRVSEPPASPAASEPPAITSAEPAAPPAASDDTPPTLPPAEPEPAPERVKVSPSGRWLVAEGKLVVCAAGKVGAFQEIRAIDVGGQEAFDELIESGTVVPAKR